MRTRLKPPGSLEVNPGRKPSAGARAAGGRHENKAWREKTELSERCPPAAAQAPSRKNGRDQVAPLRQLGNWEVAKR